MLTFLQLLGLVLAGFMIKYREKLGDIIGDAYWMRYVGGVYNFIILLAVFIFFWCIAALTGTQDIFFYPLYVIFGGVFKQ